MTKLQAQPAGRAEEVSDEAWDRLSVWMRSCSTCGGRARHPPGRDCAGALDVRDPARRVATLPVDGAVKLDLVELERKLSDWSASDPDWAPACRRVTLALIARVRELEAGNSMAIERAVDAALGEVARQQGGIAGTLAKEARSDGVTAGKTYLNAFIKKGTSSTPGG